MIDDREAFRLYRWDELPLEKVTEMVSRKIVSGTREMVAQHYMKKGALVPVHAHESEQMTYVLQGGLRFLINGEEITVREGEVLHIPSWVPHQAEAIDDTFEPMMPLTSCGIPLPECQPPNSTATSRRLRTKILIRRYLMLSSWTITPTLS